MTEILAYTWCLGWGVTGAVNVGYTWELYCTWEVVTILSKTILLISFVHEDDYYEGNVLFNDALNTFYGYLALGIW